MAIKKNPFGNVGSWVDQNIVQPVGESIDKVAGRPVAELVTGSLYRGSKPSLLAAGPSTPSPQETTDEAKKAYLKEKQDREQAGGSSQSLLGGGASIFNKRKSSILGMGA